MRLEILDQELLQRALDDPSPSVRMRAAELAPRLVGQPRYREPSSHRGTAAALALAIAPLLDDPTCAEMAAFALGELGVADPIVVAGLEHQALHHDDALCRESAVAALGALGAGRATVLAATADVATVRRRAVIALSNFEGAEVDDALEQALHDRDWQVRQAAEDLLTPLDTDTDDTDTDDTDTEYGR